MTIEEMKEVKKVCGYSYAQIAAYAGIPLSTVQKIFTGITTAPRYDTLQKLNKLFSQDWEQYKYMTLQETGVYHTGEKKKKQQGEYTLDDYYQIPDDRRVELIDGVIYDMGAPTLNHQAICSIIHYELFHYIKGKKGTCRAFFSPIDVQLDRDDRTMVQPDVLVLCDRQKMIQRCVYGAPDFVLEVLSPDSKKRDSFTKLAKYEHSGVREYWVVDPELKRVVVYVFDKDIIPTIYGFDSEIPVAIFQNELKISMAEVFEYADVPEE